MPRRLRVATRGSELARWQADHVAERLIAAHPGLAVDLVVVETTGDRRRDVPVWELGGQGVFVKEVQAAVLDGRADAGRPLGQGPAVDHRRRVCAWPRCPDGPTPATPWSARRWPACPPAPRSPPARSAAGPSWPGCGPTSPSPACGATSPPGSPRPATATPSWWPWPPCGGWAWQDRVGRGPRAGRHAAPGGPGRAGRRVPGRRRRGGRPAGRHRGRAGAAGGRRPSGRSWPGSAAAATCRSAPTPPRRRRRRCASRR